MAVKGTGQLSLGEVLLGGVVARPSARYGNGAELVHYTAFAFFCSPFIRMCRLRPKRVGSGWNRSSGINFTQCQSM